MPVCLITPENKVTVKNLLTALESESNAHAKYTAYADRADSEGLHRAASLLRAVARSEQIHVANHACIIRRLGGDPEALVQAVDVKTTLENLTSALGDEIDEVDSMYPRLLVENRSINDSAARTLTWALEAEKIHTRLLSEEIERMETVRSDSLASTPVDYYIRPVCGYISKTPEPERCWVCSHLCSTFETVR